MSKISRFKFTNQRLEKLTCPPGLKSLYCYDSETPGLALYVSETGVRTFYLYKKINGRPVRFKLGKWPHEIGIDDARKQCVIAAGRIAGGDDPHSKRLTARREMTLGDLWFIHIEHARQHNRPSTVEENESQWRTHFEGWANRKLSEITRSDVERLHRSIGETSGRYAANRALALIHHIYAKTALRTGYVGDNPARGIERFKEKTRDRFMTADEIPKFFAALNAEPQIFQDLYRVALLTGARRSNLQGMCWTDVDLNACVWTIPADDAKAGQAIHVPLSADAVDILTRRRKADPTGEYVFPGRGVSGHIVEIKSSWARITKRAGIEGMRFHDLRRSTGSWLAASGVSLPIIGKLLGHRSASTTQVYARLSLDPVREAVNTGTAAMMNAAKGGAK